MKSFIRNLTITSLAVWALVGTGMSTNAVTFEVNPGAGWIGYMNVFDIPQNVGGGPYPPNLGPYQFGSGWGTADLCANWTSSALVLSPNTIGDPNPYWYIPSGQPGAIGNKIMDANMYVEVGSLPGQSVTFAGTVLANTLVGQTDLLGNGWTSVAFIKDFAPDYSSFVSVTVPLTPGPFSISLNTINDGARHVQYGFETLGPDVWITDVGNFGNIQIEAVPEPSVLALLGLALGIPTLLRRRQ
jgi:hypothetical protein